VILIIGPERVVRILQLTISARVFMAVSGLLAIRTLVALAGLFLLVLSHVLAEDVPKSSPVPDAVCAKLQALFQQYYPTATVTNRNVNGIHFEHEVRTFEFPYTGPPGGKHESSTQRGPMKGGILCSIHLQKGEYRGQVALVPRGGGQHQPALIDKKMYQQLLMAPYSTKRDAHLWVSLSYPNDTSDDFLKAFRALMNDFEKDAD
jgi:hypothetical protein